MVFIDENFAYVILIFCIGRHEIISDVQKTIDVLSPLPDEPR